MNTSRERERERERVGQVGWRPLGEAGKKLQFTSVIKGFLMGQNLGDKNHIFLV